jgi:membrane protease YdiL (CAAX protease family)
VSHHHLCPGWLLAEVALHRISGSWAAGLVVVVLAVGLAVDHAIGGAHVAVDLGLARPAWPAGLRWGGAAALLVAAAYALVLLAAPLRHSLPQEAGGDGRAVLTAVLVVIPLGTVLPEELAFRGLLLSLLGRGYGMLAGTWLSSGLFGLWHVLAALGGGAANAAITGAVGGGAPGTAARVVVTVVFTSLGGAALCWLRLRSGSLLAPALAHWTVNALGVIVIALA